MRVTWRMSLAAVRILSAFRGSKRPTTLRWSTIFHIRSETRISKDHRNHSDFPAYTGIILSTRESEEMRTELFNYGVSQISAGSRTNPGAYSEGSADTGSQFSLGDHRSLEEVISSVIDSGYIPSFCTGCYRKGRVGNDFMDLAKPGLIKEFCMPNAVLPSRSISPILLHRGRGRRDTR